MRDISEAVSIAVDDYCNGRSDADAAERGMLADYITQRIIELGVQGATNSRPHPTLSLRNNTRASVERLEWCTPCGCAYYAFPRPRVEVCDEHRHEDKTASLWARGELGQGAHKPAAQIRAAGRALFADVLKLMKPYPAHVSTHECAWPPGTFDDGGE